MARKSIGGLAPRKSVASKAARQGRYKPRKYINLDPIVEALEVKDMRDIKLVVRKPIREWTLEMQVEVFEPRDGSYFVGKIVGPRHVKFVAAALPDDINVNIKMLRFARGDSYTLEKLGEVPGVGSVVDVFHANFNNSWWKATVTDVDSKNNTVDVQQIDGSSFKNIPLSRLRWNLETNY